MSDNLDTLNDTDLNRYFTTEVDVWKRFSNQPGVWITGLGKFSPRHQNTINYCLDASAVVPFLERWRYADISWNRITLTWTITLQTDGPTTMGLDFARTAVIALIRGKRASDKFVADKLSPS